MSKNSRCRELHQQLVIDRFLFDFDKVHPQFFGERSQDIVFFDDPHFNEHPVDSFSGRLGQSSFDLRLCDETVSNESLSDIHSSAVTILRWKKQVRKDISCGVCRRLLKGQSWWIQNAVFLGQNGKTAGMQIHTPLSTIALSLSMSFEPVSAPFQVAASGRIE